MSSDDRRSAWHPFSRVATGIPEPGFKPRFNWVTQVHDFHRKFGLPVPNGPSACLSDPQLPSRDVCMARAEAMLEEVLEFMQAARARDLPGMVDAVIDLMYFALGTLLVLGVGNITAERCFQEVHRANMDKRAVRGDGRSGSGTFRLVKPEGWQEPRLETILKEAGWEESPQHTSNPHAEASDEGT